MRVFTQRIITNLLSEYINAPNYWTASPGISPVWDELYDQFNSKYPGVFPGTANPLDYCIILGPPVYIIGKYWGGEETLGMATEWITARNSVGWMPATVLTCDDDQHPTEFTIEQLLLNWPPEYASAIDDHVKVGYYLPSDPDAFVLAT
jgi:hypothetical protein